MATFSFLFISFSLQQSSYGKGKSNIYPYVVSRKSHFSQEIYNIVQILNMLNEFSFVVKYKHKVNFKEKKCLDSVKPLCSTPPSRRGKAFQFHKQEVSSVFITQ